MVDISNEEKILEMLEGLAQGQLRMETRLSKLEEGQLKLEEGQLKLEEGQLKLEECVGGFAYKFEMISSDISELKVAQTLLGHKFAALQGRQELAIQQLGEVSNDTEALKEISGLLVSGMSTLSNDMAFLTDDMAALKKEALISKSGQEEILERLGKIDASIEELSLLVDNAFVDIYNLDMRTISMSKLRSAAKSA